MCFKNKRSDVRKIYKTTDGYFTSNFKIKKPRRVAVLYQRDDGAVILVRIHSKKGKDLKNFVPNFTLKSKKHKSLSEDSIVYNKLIFGRKVNGKFEKIHPNDFIYLDDKLSYSELFKLRRKINSNKFKHKISKYKLIRKWNNHFK